MPNTTQDHLQKVINQKEIKICETLLNIFISDQKLLVKMFRELSPPPSPSGELIEPSEFVSLLNDLANTMTGLVMTVELFLDSHKNISK